MFYDTKRIRVDDAHLEVTVNSIHVIIEDTPDMWVCLSWKEWDKIKETVEKLKKKHEKEIKYITL